MHRMLKNVTKSICLAGCVCAGAFAVTPEAQNAAVVADAAPNTVAAESPAQESSKPALDTIRTTFPDGKIARVYTVQHGTEIREGVAVTYHPNGKVAIEAPYVNGKLNGVFRSYYESGKTWQTIGYKDGVEEGLSTNYFESGRKQSREFYKAGILNGVSEEWDDRGVIRSKFPYLRGQMHGKAVFYDDLGAVQEEMDFQFGMRQGKYRRYKKGVMTMEADFDRNRCVKNCNF